MSRGTKSVDDVYDVSKNIDIRDNVKDESLWTFESDLISSKSDLNICSRALTTRFIWRRFETHITWEVRIMRLSVCTVWKKELNVCSIFLLSKTNDVRFILCSIEEWRIARILMSLSLRCKWYSLIYVSFEVLTSSALSRKRLVNLINSRKKRSNRWKK